MWYSLDYFYTRATIGNGTDIREIICLVKSVNGSVNWCINTAGRNDTPNGDYFHEKYKINSTHTMVVVSSGANDSSKIFKKIIHEGVLTKPSYVETFENTLQNHEFPG